MSERLDTVSEQRLEAQAAIGLVVEVLSKELGEKLKMAFDLLQDDQWSQDVHKPAIAPWLWRGTSTPAYKERTKGALRSGGRGPCAV